MATWEDMQRFWQEVNTPKAPEGGYPFRGRFDYERDSKIDLPTPISDMLSNVFVAREKPIMEVSQNNSNRIVRDIPKSPVARENENIEEFFALQSDGKNIPDRKRKSWEVTDENVKQWIADKHALGTSGNPLSSEDLSSVESMMGRGANVVFGKDGLTFSVPEKKRAGEAKKSEMDRMFDLFQRDQIAKERALKRFEATKPSLYRSPTDNPEDIAKALALNEQKINQWVKENTAYGALAGLNAPNNMAETLMRMQVAEQTARSNAAKGKADAAMAQQKMDVMRQSNALDVLPRAIEQIDAQITSLTDPSNPIQSEEQKQSIQSRVAMLQQRKAELNNALNSYLGLAVGGGQQAGGQAMGVDPMAVREEEMRRRALAAGGQ